MNIVVLDGGTTNPGDLSWAPLERLGQVTVYSQTPQPLVVERLATAQAALLNRASRSPWWWSGWPRPRPPC